jgi:hypothetical protein
MAEMGDVHDGLVGHGRAHGRRSLSRRQTGWNGKIAIASTGRQDVSRTTLASNFKTLIAADAVPRLAKRERARYVLL